MVSRHNASSGIEPEETHMSLRSWTQLLVAVCMTAAMFGAEGARGQPVSDPMVPVPLPAQVPAKEGLAPLTDTHLWYWDTGGDGAPVVLLHPASGSGLIWGYQQPVLAKAGYRVIAYSRRAYYGSHPLPKARPGVAS